MDAIVLEDKSSVSILDEKTQYINHSSTENAVIDNNSTVFVSTTNIETVLLEKDNSTILVTGIAGPPGADGKSEEEMVYSKRIDFVTEDIIYKAEAAAGTSILSPGWRIRKVVISADGDVSETWASGNTNFDKVWADRLTYTYM